MRVKAGKAVAFFIIIMALLVGCATEKYPENAVASVNGVIITEQDIDQEITERQMSLAIYEKLTAQEPNQLTPKETVLLLLGITENELTPEQSRYIESWERSTTKMLSRNEAFNILLREEVYYQEAVKHGHEVSLDEAKKIIMQSSELSQQAIELGGEEEKLEQKVIIKNS